MCIFSLTNIADILDYDEDMDPLNSDEDEEEIIFGMRRPANEERPPNEQHGAAIATFPIQANT